MDEHLVYRVVRLNRYFIHFSIVDASNNSRMPTVTMYESLQKKAPTILHQIKKSLDELNEKMDVIIEIQRHHQEKIPSIPDGTLDVMTLLSLPDHLRKTAITLCRLGEATADEIAEQTRRARAVESGYLNQLVLMGYLKKERRGRKAYFYAESQS